MSSEHSTFLMISLSTKLMVASTLSLGPCTRRIFEFGSGRSWITCIFTPNLAYDAEI